jgi:DNA-binding CsgD family transcriptional regulator
MSNIVFAAIALISICGGLYAIFLTYRLNKKFRLNYLSLYLYFQIFINVFGFYGILGKDIAQKILVQQQSSFQTIEKISHFFTFLGIPFLIIAWYMFIRLSREVIGKKLSRTFTMGFLFALSVVFAVYGAAIISLNVSSLTDEQFALISNVFAVIYVAVEVLILSMALLWLLFQIKKLEDIKTQKAVRTFTYLYLIGFFVDIAVYVLAWQDSSFTPIYLLIFTLKNIPPLLSWRYYLERHYISSTIPKAETQIWTQFLAEHNISNREEEVIRHLSAGKSNKEISEALFISLQTVKDHIYRIYQKTDVKNRVQLINLIQSYKNK